MDDTLHSHPKTRRAGLAAMGLWTVCGSYCMAYKTNGFVPEWFVAGFQSGRKLAADLVRAGKWEDAVKDNEKGWQFHDWLDYQQSAEEIERAEAWLCKLTAAGTEVVEYRAPCTGIARPDRPGGDA